jgi:hypothetical protein
MKTQELNESNTTLKLTGSEATRSMDIKSVEVKKWPAAGGNLELHVLDEKDITIYSQELEPAQESDAGAITVGKRFVFYDHLSVQIIARKEGSSYSVKLNFE